MTPNDVLLDSLISVLLSLPQRSFLLQMGTNTETPQLNKVQRGLDLGLLGPNWDMFIKSLTLPFRGPCGRGGGKTVKVRGDGRHQGTKAF